MFLWQPSPAHPQLPPSDRCTADGGEGQTGGTRGGAGVGAAGLKEKKKCWGRWKQSLPLSGTWTDEYSNKQLPSDQLKHVKANKPLLLTIGSYYLWMNEWMNEIRIAVQTHRTTSLLRSGRHFHNTLRAQHAVQLTLSLGWELPLS